MRTLNLTLKKKWFDMTESGIKTEDYREITPHWVKILFEFNIKMGGLPLQIIYELLEGRATRVKTIRHFTKGYKKFDVVKEYNGGYFSDSLPNNTYEHLGTTIGRGNPDWGAPTDRDVFIIKLGERR